MVSDQEIASCVESLIRQSGVISGASSPSVSSVVQQLEAKLGLDLSHKAGFIRDQINLHLPVTFKDNRQQFLGGQLLPQHRFPPSPFSHLTPQDELTFRSAPSAAMQSHQILPQKPAQVQAHSATSVAPVVKQEAHFASGNLAPPAVKDRWCFMIVLCLYNFPLA